MKISIFPDVFPLPKSKEEKHQESKKASQCVVKVAANDDQLVDLVSKHAWSPFIFENNKRLSSNFISTDFLVYDCDDGMTIEEAEVIVTREKLCCLCLPSTSHTPEHHRFRIILPLARTITNAEVYAQTWEKGAEMFGGVIDIQTKDLGRFYFSCTTDDGFWLEGDFFSPVIPIEKAKSVSEYTGGSLINVTEDLSQLVEQIYGEKREKIPEAVDFFLRNAHTGLPGKWVNSLNAFCFSLALSGVDDGVIMDLCEQIFPSPPDKKDIYQINRSIRDGKAAI